MSSRYIGCFLLLWSLWSQTQAQEVQIVEEKSLVTGKDVKWRIEGEDKVVVRDSSTHYVQIYIRDTEEVLYGNRCAEEIAKQKRIEFIIIPKDIGYGMSKTNFFFSNLGNSIKAFFRNGPFWKSRIKKKIRRCRKDTGDYVG
ncbi:MAG: hypothetical protein ACFB0B_12810 [Thermonemataceae bacterium]